MSSRSLTQELKEHALSIGFTRLGITSAAQPDDFNRYRSWAAKGFAAEMGYLTETGRMARRGDLSLLLADAKSVIVGAISYAPKSPDHASNVKFARYAWGADYHVTVKRKLEKLATWLAAHSPDPFCYVSYVDTGPILEKSLAQRAGIGWIGKNTCLINQSIGSYFVVGELITTLELQADRPTSNHCGSCMRCLEACPTNALVAPYELDARKCISYHTTENRASELPEEIASKLDGWIGGCDICQEVCPWNQKGEPAQLPEMHPLPHTELAAEEILKLTRSTHRSLFGPTALNRISLRNLKRNIRAQSK